MALNLTDKTGNGNNLTNNGASETTDTLYAASQIAMDCTGGNNYASIADNASISITGDLTIEAGIYMDNLPSGNSQTICAKDDGSSNRSWDFRVNETTGSYFVQFLYSDNGSSTTTHNVEWTTPLVDTWYNVAMVFDASAHSTEVFINGSSIGSDSSGTKTSIFDGNADMTIGIARGTTFPFDGYLDEVRIWNDKRTSTEINNNKSKQLTGNESSFIAYYDFEPSSGGIYTII